MFFFLCIISLIFCVLYHRFLSGNFYYIYTDIGQDTIDTYIPSLYYLVEAIKNGTFELYSLQNGLGLDVFSFLTDAIDPFSIILLVLPLKAFPYGIIVMTFLKTLATGIFSWFFFKRLFYDNFVVMSSSIIWTFCAYIVVWGQHYQFATAMVYFTALMLCLQRFLEKKIKSVFFLILCLALYMAQNIYMAYMSGIFCAVYTVFYMYFQRKTINKILVQLFKLLVFAILAALLASVIILPWIGVFLGSARTGGGETALADLLKPVPLKYYYSFISRLFSANILGIPANGGYIGVLNYYEFALLSTSTLSFFAVGYLLSQRKNRKKSIIVIAIVIFCLFFPLTGRLLTFANNYRFTFMFSFIMVIAIGIFLENVKNVKESRIFFISGLIPMLLLLMITIFGVYRTRYFGVTAAIISGLILLGYMIFFLFSFKIKKKTLENWLLLFICIEMVVMNYSSINDRYFISKERWESSDYNDGTAKVIEDIDDESIYRLVKTYHSYGYNDSFMQGYFPTEIYSSLITKNTNEFVQNSGGKVLPNRVSLSYKNYIPDTLLSVKYLVSKNPEFTHPYYEFYKEVDGKYVYKNKNYLSFGYTYFNQINKEDISNADIEKKLNGLWRGFYFTEGITDDKYKEVQLSEENTESVFEKANKLNEISLQNTVFENSTLTGNIDNTEEKVGMLCIPIIYDDNWELWVNGKKQIISNINGGLIGIEIQPGHSVIKLKYTPFMLKKGKIISVFAWIFFLGVSFYIYCLKNRIK